MAVLNHLSQEQRKKHANTKILVVDDQQEIRSLIREVLLDAGITQVYEAADGKAALQFIDADFEMVNCIICDWNMPSLNGCEFLKQIRSVDNQVPFLMVSSRSDKQSILEARTAGVSAYIRKPFSPIQIEEKLRILLGETLMPK